MHTTTGQLFLVVNPNLGNADTPSSQCKILEEALNQEATEYLGGEVSKLINRNSLELLIDSANFGTGTDNIH